MKILHQYYIKTDNEKTVLVHDYPTKRRGLVGKASHTITVYESAEKNPIHVVYLLRELARLATEQADRIEKEDLQC